jgi:hypothetical protein
MVAPFNGPKYVLPWAPEWPYGSERIGSYVRTDARRLDMARGVSPETREVVPRRGPQRLLPPDVGASSEGFYGALSTHAVLQVAPIAIVEGAVDTLALRALYPRMSVVGVPGIKGWRASWAKLLGADVRVALDRGKPNKQGIIEEDRAAARIALDCSGRGYADDVDDWMMLRHKAGKGLFCVLCGRDEAWLCGACGRRRAPEGMDWGGVWREKRQPDSVGANLSATRSVYAARERYNEQACL